MSTYEIQINYGNGQSSNNSTPCPNCGRPPRYNDAQLRKNYLPAYNSAKRYGSNPSQYSQSRRK